jgi:hypothetical protein
LKYKTCNHIYDTRHFCGSVAARDRDYCVYHLRYRGRLMRMAQARARNQHLGSWAIGPSASKKPPASADDSALKITRRFKRRPSPSPK